MGVCRHAGLELGLLEANLRHLLLVPLLPRLSFQFEFCMLELKPFLGQHGVGLVQVNSNLRDVGVTLPFVLGT